MFYVSLYTYTNISHIVSMTFILFVRSTLSSYALAYYIDTGVLLLDTCTNRNYHQFKDVFLLYLSKLEILSFFGRLSVIKLHFVFFMNYSVSQLYGIYSTDSL